MITGIRNIIITALFSLAFLFPGEKMEARYRGQWDQAHTFVASHSGVEGISCSIDTCSNRCTIKSSKAEADHSGMRDGLYKLLQLTKRRWNRVISYCDELINPAISEKISDIGDYVASPPTYVIDVAFFDKNNIPTDSLSFLIPHSLAIG